MLWGESRGTRQAGLPAGPARVGCRPGHMYGQVLSYVISLTPPCFWPCERVVSPVRTYRLHRRACYLRVVPTAYLTQLSCSPDSAHSPDRPHSRDPDAQRSRDPDAQHSRDPGAQHEAGAGVYMCGLVHVSHARTHA